MEGLIQYAYDYQNRWVRKALDSDGDGHLGGRRIFVYDVGTPLPAVGEGSGVRATGSIVLDFHRANSQDMQIGHLRERYLWGPAVDQILAEEAVDGGTADLVQWTLTDHLNTVRDIAKYDPETGATTVVNHLVYDAFGKVTSESNPAVNSLFLFTARPFDEDTQLQNNLNRWYDASVGRWLSEDPVKGDINLCRCVRNNPRLLTDPTGLYEIEWEGDWTDGQKQKIENAMSAVKARADALVNEIDKYLDGLSPCMRRELGHHLKGLKRVLEKISAGIASEGENLELYHSTTGNDEPFASTYPAGWYGINGFWSDAEITFNDDARPTSWQTASANELGHYLFHELTHLYGTEDDDSEGPLNNAHNIDDLWDKGLDRWPSLGSLKRAAQKKCECPREPGLQRPGFPDPFGFPWIF